VLLPNKDPSLGSKHHQMLCICKALGKIVFGSSFAQHNRRQQKTGFNGCKYLGKNALSSSTHLDSTGTLKGE
jgi:hypothetical protein